MAEFITGKHPKAWNNYGQVTYYCENFRFCFNFFCIFRISQDIQVIRQLIVI